MAGRRLPRVLISILNWNHADNTEACLRSLRQAGYLGREDIEVIVSDNASAQDDAARAQKIAASLGVEFRRNTVNLGFAGGHNALLCEAIQQGVEFVWLLNNDCLVEPGVLEGLLAQMLADARCAAASPCLVYEDTRAVYFCGARHDWTALRSVWANWGEHPAFLESHQDTVWLVGTALMLRSHALQQVGLLNEALFAYYEDDELGVRLAAAGWRSVVCTDQFVQHNKQADQGSRRAPYFYYLTARNSAWFYLRAAPPAARAMIHLRLAAQADERCQSLLEEGRGDLAQAVRLGFADGLRARLGPPRLDASLTWDAFLLLSAARIGNILHAALQSFMKRPV